MLTPDHPLIQKMMALVNEAEDQCPNVANGIQLIIRGALKLPTPVGTYAINAGHLMLDAIEMAQRVGERRLEALRPKVPPPTAPQSLPPNLRRD